MNLHMKGAVLTVIATEVQSPLINLVKLVENKLQPMVDKWTQHFSPFFIASPFKIEPQVLEL